MAKRKTKAVPFRFEVSAHGLEGYASVTGGLLRVTATKGAHGSKTTQVGGSGGDPAALQLLAETLLWELQKK